MTILSALIHRDLTEEERFDVQAEQRYRTMTGMDESRERRAERARERQRNAKSLDHKTW